MGEIIRKERHARRGRGVDRGAWRRPAAVLSSGLAALLVWAVAHLMFGIPVRRPTFDGAVPPQTVTGPVVLVVSLLLSSAGWTLLCLLERVSARPRRAWTMAALLVLLVSLAAPLSGGGAGVADRATLVMLHLVVGVVLIPPLAASAVTRRRPTRLAEHAPGNGPTASPES
jgi:hypothetical protein